MLEIIKKELNVSIISSLIYIILGIVIIASPAAMLNIVSVSIAVLTIITGAIITIINLVNIKEEGNLLLGTLLIVLGIALIIYPTSLNLLISLGIGIWFISTSVNRIKIAVLFRGAKSINWLVILITAIITFCIGVSFIFTPLTSAVALTTLAGILMIAYSVCDIFEILFIKKNMEALESILE